MRISEFIIQKLKLFFNPQSAICSHHSVKFFSLSQQWILFGLALFILGLLYLRFYHHPSLAPQAIVKESVVEVSGEVQNPGVYLFQNQPTLKEAIERAGGLKEITRFEIPSSSEILETGTLLIVSQGLSKVSESPPHPSSLPPEEKEKHQRPLLKGEIRGGKYNEIRIKISRMAANKLLVFSVPLDLNQVSMEDLCLIPGIGESLAQEVIAYRERRRGFRSVEELKNVRGVGEKKYKNLKEFFTVNK